MWTLKQVQGDVRSVANGLLPKSVDVLMVTLCGDFAFQPFGRGVPVLASLGGPQRDKGFTDSRSHALAIAADEDLSTCLDQRP
jgi:hypothetical protein